MDTKITPSSDTSPTYAEATEPITRQRDLGRNVPGWGADLDHANRPAYPMERTPPRLDNVHWERPADQPRTVKVFHSIERPGLTPVFGTSTPPSGLSGVMRGLAYKYSENDLRHWFILMAADRVNVGEGLIDDLLHGHVPNLFKEMGGPAEWKHNRQGFIKKAVIVSALAGAAIYLVRRRRHRPD